MLSPPACAVLSLPACAVLSPPAGTVLSTSYCSAWHSTSSRRWPEPNPKAWARRPEWTRRPRVGPGPCTQLAGAISPSARSAVLTQAVQRAGSEGTVYRP